MAIANASLSSLSLRCADISIGRTGVDVTDAGDGFASLDVTSPSVLQALKTIASTPIGGVYVHRNSSLLTGANIFLLNYIAAQTGMQFTVETVFLSDALFFGGNRTAQIQYLFQTLHYDCLVTGTEIRGDRSLIADFLLPNEQMGLSVVTPSASPVEYPALKLLFAWTQPFSWTIWLTIVLALLGSACVMFVFEADDTTEDFGDSDLGMGLRISQGFYRAFINFTASGSFSPTTPAGQAFNAAFTFSMMLFQATYTANLAAYFTRTETTGVSVSDITQFVNLNVPACISDDPYVKQLIVSAFPQTKLVVVNSMLPSDMLDSIVNGTCAGGITPDLPMRYALGPQDPTGKYCTMSLTAGLLSQSYFGVPFNRATVHPPVMAALNSVAATAYTFGDYAVGASMPNFPQARSQCTPPVVISPLASLQINQVSGIFFVMAWGVAMGLIMYAFFTWEAFGYISRAHHGTLLEQALEARQERELTSIKARHEAEMASLKLDEAKGTVDLTVEGMVVNEKHAHKAVGAWLARTSSSVEGGMGLQEGTSDSASKGAVELLLAALRREATALNDVPASTRAAVDAAVGDRGATVRLLLQLCDGGGEPFGPPVPSLPLARSTDVHFLLTRLATHEAALFTKQLRALADDEAPIPALDSEAAEWGAKRKPLNRTGLDRPASDRERAAEPRTDRQYSRDRSERSGPARSSLRVPTVTPTPEPGLKPIAFPSLASLVTTLTFGHVRKQAEEPPAQQSPYEPPRGKGSRRSPNGSVEQLRRDEAARAELASRWRRGGGSGLVKGRRIPDFEDDV